MNLDKLNKKAVRSTRSTSTLTRLDEKALKTVVAGRAIDDPSTCEIHFYYPADGVE